MTKELECQTKDVLCVETLLKYSDPDVTTGKSAELQE